MGSPPIDAAVAGRLYRRAGAGRWNLPQARWLEALDASAGRVFAGKSPAPREVERYLESLHLDDLAVACACAEGDDAAWEHFVREQRPQLYRAADVLDPGGGARDLADSLYADLYGVEEGRSGRRSLFRYFHGRSSLATWLRAVLAQRHVDRLRAGRRFEPLPDEDRSGAAVVSPEPRPHNPERPRYLALLGRALAAALARLAARDRLRLGCYYAEGLTLAQIGRLVGEHEATVSRHLARARRTIRDDIERQLRNEDMTDTEISECLECAMEDPGPIDVTAALESSAAARDRAGIVPSDTRAVQAGGLEASRGLKGEG